MDNFNVVVMCSRDFDDYNLLKDTLDVFISVDPNTVILCGDSASDLLVIKYSDENDIGRLVFSVKEQDEISFMARNFAISELANYGIMFWDGKSPTTANMIQLLKDNNIQHDIHLI